jgi:hypothetical protein
VITPLATAAIEIVKSNFKKNLKVIPGKYSKHLFQKTAILGISHLIRKVLQAET